MDEERGENPGGFPETVESASGIDVGAVNVADAPAEQQAHTYRDSNGRLLPGNPHAWTKENHPISPGRPPITKKIADALEAFMGRECKLPGARGRTNDEVFLEQWFLLAMKGNGTALREFLERRYGKVALPIKMAPPPDEIESFSGFDIEIVEKRIVDIEKIRDELSKSAAPIVPALPPGEPNGGGPLPN